LRQKDGKRAFPHALRTGKNHGVGQAILSDGASQNLHNTRVAQK
jgi:hypothetical protein